MWVLLQHFVDIAFTKKYSTIQIGGVETKTAWIHIDPAWCKTSNYTRPDMDATKEVVQDGEYAYMWQQIMIPAADSDSIKYEAWYKLQIWHDIYIYNRSRTCTTMQESAKNSIYADSHWTTQKRNKWWYVAQHELFLVAARKERSTRNYFSVLAILHNTAWELLLP